MMAVRNAVAEPQKEDGVREKGWIEEDRLRFASWVV
jgi:hypothetical protein